MKMVRKIMVIAAVVLAVSFLSIIPISLMAIGPNGKKELPMFGDNPQTTWEYRWGQLYVKWTLWTVGDKDKAFERDWERGWIWFQEKDYRWAMKVFNRAWLIKPEDPRIFNAYGALAEVSGDREDALSWYRKGAEKGDPKAKINFDLMKKEILN